MGNRLDEIAPNFHLACNRWPDASNLQAHYDDLAQTFEHGGSSIIELCKSFVECVCITIINETNGTLPNNGSTTQYLVAALEQLGLRNTRGSSIFDKVLSAYNRLADALNEVRNSEGSVAHGKDGFIDTITEHHARVYLLSADTILLLLLQAYEGVEPSLIRTRDPHTRFEFLNKKIDLSTQVEALTDEDGVLSLFFRTGTDDEGFELRVTPSEILYYLDRQAYINVVDLLRGMTPVEESGDEFEEDEVEETEQPVTELFQPEKRIPSPLLRRVQPVTEYQGRFEKQVTPFYEFVLHRCLDSRTKQYEEVQNFVYTLLASMDDLAVVDWYKRPSTRSAVRLRIKRLIALFNIDGLTAEKVDPILRWMEEHINGEQQ